MATWNTLSDGRKAAAGQVFDALSTLDALTDFSADSQISRAVGFADLYAYATEPDRPMDERLQRALASDARLRGDLDRLLENTALYRFPRLAAASSGENDRREGDGFTIRLRQSRAEETQTYVIIEVHPGKEAPSTLFIFGAGHPYGKFPLPAAQDGVIQLLSETSSDLVKALLDVHTEVFIR
ncbi:MAG: hypothetical protein IH626_02370 [Rhodospirillales bacterium]|nr:hypothetical protein [Rhodospirillales bacterium]